MNQNQPNKQKSDRNSIKKKIIIKEENSDILGGKKKKKYQIIWFSEHLKTLNTSKKAELNNSWSA